MKLSVIVPSFNAELTIRRCLDSLLRQNVADGYEIKSAAAEPVKVKISAAPSKLKGMTVVKTKPLNIAKLNANSTPIVELDLPEAAITDANMVKVDLQIGKIDSEPVRESVNNNTEIIIKHKLTVEEKEILKDIIKEVQTK